jgi:hypothetical protein
MIEQTFQLKRSTTGYWFDKARQAGWVGLDGGGEIQMGHIGKLGGRRYQARWVDPKAVGSAPKIFTRRTVAEDKITELEASKLDGSYVDHKNKITVAEYASSHRPTYLIRTRVRVPKRGEGPTRCALGFLPVVDAKSNGLLWTALEWATAASHQTERVRASFEPYRVSMLNLPDGVVMRVTPEMQRPRAIFWADVHFLMIAVRHLDLTLQKLGRGAPRLDRALSEKAVVLRNLLEHWWEAEQGKKRWKRYRDKHGPYANPTQVQFEPGDPGDLRIGADPLSVVDLAADIRRVESQLIEIEART